MKKTILYVLWGFLFLLCAGLSFIPEPTGLGKTLLVLLSLVFFVPGGLLLWTAVREKERKTLRLVRLLASLSLGLTLVVLLFNLVSFAFPEAWGTPLYVLLVLVSSPMVCSQYWVVSLFLWACLLLGSFKKISY